jgi:UDP-N-acetylglucosamine 1-carboxyvinyltransferase
MYQQKRAGGAGWQLTQPRETESLSASRSAARRPVARWPGARRPPSFAPRPVICENTSGMDAFRIQGNRPLRGTVRVHGSKNAALPLMAASLLTDQPVALRDVPDLSDIRNQARLLGRLGIDVQRDPDTDPRAYTLQTQDTSLCQAPYEIVRTMRAGICVLGPLLGRRGHAEVSMPGGCAIGDRPVDLHLRGLRALGAEIELDEGYILARAPAGRLKGAHVFMGGPNGSTVLGTANVLSAAVLAEGTTVIESAACEPEIADLADLLTQMGASISGAGSPVIRVEGVPELGGAEHTIMADRIAAGTFLMAGAITNGDITLENFPTAALTAALDRLSAIGVELQRDGQLRATNGSAAIEQRMRETVRVVSQRRLQPVQVVTQPHPGFPTDLQAQIMALLSLADGNSIVTEKIFPERFLHVAELMRMGANLIRQGPTVMASGTRQLIGAPVMASDLRASAGLVLAGLAANGVTTVNRVYHLDRGYEQMETVLQQLGAEIERIDDSG